jgi:hypothetical protein
MISREEERGTKQRLPLLYKMALVKSTDPKQLDLSIPGNLALNFFKEMKESRVVAESTEAVECANILRNSFREYSVLEFRWANKKFEEEISAADPIEVARLVKHQEDMDKERRNFELQSKPMTDKLLEAMQMKEYPAARRLFVAALVKFSASHDPGRHRVIDTLLFEFEKMNRGFTKEVMDMAAIYIYNEIVKAIRESDLKKALLFISKYTVLFRGNPGTPNYQEIDSFEKKFFKIIETNNLWDVLS